MFWKKNIVYAICCANILLFTYAALSKILDYEKFTAQIGQSPMLTSHAGFYAIMVPIIEIIISVALSMQRFRKIGLYASFSLMVMFTAYIIAITQFSSFVPCSCGGILSKMTWDIHLYFNLSVVAVNTVAIIFEENFKEQIDLKDRHIKITTSFS
jgi:uncharacterized membrane protein YphA (DoxX/SURF4 family)